MKPKKHTQPKKMGDFPPVNLLSGTIGSYSYPNGTIRGSDGTVYQFSWPLSQDPTNQPCTFFIGPQKNEVCILTINGQTPFPGTR